MSVNYLDNKISIYFAHFEACPRRGNPWDTVHDHLIVLHYGY
jgi:hypothetical protein